MVSPNKAHTELARDLESALYAVRREGGPALSEYTLARLSKLAMHLDAVLFFANLDENPENNPA
jgi:hypothetical protein